MKRLLLRRRALGTLALARVMAPLMASLMASVMALLLSPAMALAQSAAAPALGVFSLLGENLQIVGAGGDTTDSRLDRNQRESLPAKDVGFDQAVLRAVRDGVARLRPNTRLAMYRATAPISLAEQRALAAGAQRGELPTWIVKAIQAERLTHVLLVTSLKADASFKVREGYSIGRGSIEGVGLYVDRLYEVLNSETGVASSGFIAPFAAIKLSLMDTNTAEVVKSYDIRDGYIVSARPTDVGIEPWNYMAPTEKIDRLRELVERSVARVLPQVLP